MNVEYYKELSHELNRDMNLRCMDTQAFPVWYFLPRTDGFMILKTLE